MADRESIERQIDEILAVEANAITLSDKLFRPDGLFNQLARTEDERRIMAQSPLFQRAQRRLNELQRTEAARFVSAVAEARSVMSDRDFLLKLERAESFEPSQ
jgi:hypothetical protein